MPGDATVLLADADVLIDYRESELAILALVARHVGRVTVLPSVLDEVQDVTVRDCAELGIEIVDAALVAERHAGVAEQVEPGDGGRASEEGLESVAVEVVDGGGQHGLLVEHVFASALLEQAGELRGREVAPGGADAQIVAPADVRCT